MTYLIIIGLIILSALFSGLTLGLMSLDVFELKRKVELGNIDAARVYPIRQQGNTLLTALLLGNVAVNSILAIFLGSIAGGVVAGIVATTLIFLFGEIIPQAIISRHALKFGALTAPLVRLLMLVTWPVVAPIGWLLDRGLGEELPTIYTKKELLKIVSEHEDDPTSSIDADEERIVYGALQFSLKIVGDVMTPRTVVTSVNLEDRLDSEFVSGLRATGHSRIPVYGESIDDIVGVMYTKRLVGITPNQTLRVADVYAPTIQSVLDSESLDNVLNKFTKTRQHLFIVRNEFDAFIGVITIEDVIEEIIGAEIVDEDDKFTDMREEARKRAEK